MQQKTRGKRLLPVRAFAVLATLALLLAACGGTPGATEDPVDEAPSEPDEQDAGEDTDDAPEQVLRIGMGSDAQSLDPPNFVLAGDFTRMALMYDTLVKFDRDGNLVPWLAESWDQIDDTTWEFKLREDVNFHDGTHLDAEAVKFVLDRSRVQDQGAGFLGMITEVEVVDDYTVRLLLDRPFAAILNNLTVAVSGIYSPAAIEEYGDDFTNNPVGSGPFKFVRWDPDEVIEVERNPDYWGPQPNLDRVLFIPIPETGTRMSALQSGQVDAIENPPPDQIELLRSDPDLEPIIEPKARPVFLGFNLEEVTDERVRRAVAHAIDKELIVEAVLEGMGNAATEGWVAPEFHENDPPINIDYDPDAARDLLAEAGAEGISLRMVLPQERYLRDAAVGEVIQSQLAEVGINLELDIRETGAWYQALLDRDTELYWLGWGMSSGDPNDMFTRVAESGAVNNMSQIADPQVDEWILELQALPVGDPRRDDLVWEVQNKIVVEDVALVPIYHMVNFFAVRSNVENFRTTTSELIDVTETVIR